MSVESARACRRRLVDDLEFMAQFRLADGPAERRAVVHGASYEFTLEELAEAHCGVTHEGEATIFGGSSGCGLTHETE